MFTAIGKAAACIVLVSGVGRALASDYPALDGQTMRVMIGSSAGQIVDLESRAFFRALETVLPETTIRIQNIKSSAALSELRDASDDALTILVSSRTPYYEQVAKPADDIDLAGVVFLGSLGSVNRILAVRKDFSESAKDLIESGKIPVLGALRPDPSAWEPMLVDYLTPLNLKVLIGMSEGEREAMILKGDINGRVGGLLELQPLFDQGVLVPIVKFNSEGYPSSLDNVPSIADLAKEGIDKEVLSAVETIDRVGGVLIAAKASMKGDTTAALQSAFAVAVADEAFLQEAAKLNAAISFTNGKELSASLLPLISEGGGVPAKIRAAIDCGSANDETGSDECK